MDLERTAKNLHPLERKLLPFLAKTEDFSELVSLSGMADVEAMRALQWLSNKGMLQLKEEEKEVIDLGENGKKYQKAGLPERRFLDALSSPLHRNELMKKASLDNDEFSVCIGLLRQKNAITIAKDTDLLITLTDAGKKMASTKLPEEAFLSQPFPLEISKIKGDVEGMKRRKGLITIEKRKVKSFTLSAEGKKLLAVKVKGESIDRLTSAMLKSGAWKGKHFRE